MAGDAGVRYGGIQHAGVLVKDTESSKQFYMQVLGMVDETDLRPGLPFPGAFVRAGASQIHLMELPNPDPLTGRPAHGGRYVFFFSHFFSCLFFKSLSCSCSNLFLYEAGIGIWLSPSKT